MNANQFAEALPQNAPPTDELKRRGISAAASEGLRKSFFPQLKSSMGALHSDPVVDFVTRYDASSIEIGMIRFGKLGEEAGGKLSFGKAEADTLLINVNTGEIEVEELGSGGHVLFLCARDGASFFDALLPAARFLGACLWNEDLAYNQAAARSIAEECTRLAGGERYSTFFSTLLGAF